jgi:hypothetical protein
MAGLADRQHGVVSIRQLIGPLGYSRNSVSRAVKAGRLHVIYRGVYAVGRSEISPRGACLAAVLTCGADALLSHYSAAWLLGIATWPPAPFHVTVPSPRRRRPPIVLHYSRTLLAEDRALTDNVPVTSLPRLLLDMAARLDERSLRRLLKRSEERRLFDLRPVESLLARAGRHPGSGRLDRALAQYRPTHFTRSTLEEAFVEAVEAAGLPQPRVNYVELGMELDVYWPEHRFAVELDVFETHGTRASFEEDRLRQEELLLAGIAVTRVTGSRFEREPEGVVERVARLLDQRGPLRV